MLILKARDMASGEVDKLHRSLGRAGSGVKGLGHAFSTLAKVGILGVITAIGTAIGFMGLATKAAAEEQVGIARMDAALKANVKGWKGNTAAIEATIAQREKLAFSDDSLRASLTILVTKYKNVAKATALQATAMDLARLKGISLEDATTMLSKGLDGSAKVLKQLEIVLPKTATEHERLAAIQKRVAGQAVAFGKTAEGAQKAFGIAVADVVEDIGAGLLPIMTQAFTWLTSTGIPAVRGIIATVQGWLAANKPLIDQIGVFLTGALKVVIGRVQDVIKWVGNFMAMITGNKDVMNALRAALAAIATAASLVWQAVSEVAKWLGQVFDMLSHDQNVIKGFAAVWNILGGAVGVVVDAFKWLFANLGKVIDMLSHLSLPDITGITNLIPHFATGGTVPGRRGEPTLAVVHGRERVTAPGSAPGAGTRDSGLTIRGMTQRELVDMVDRGLYFRLRRAGVSR
jgi:hypothetical protein